MSNLIDKDYSTTNFSFVKLVSLAFTSDPNEQTRFILVRFRLFQGYSRNISVSVQKLIALKATLEYVRGSRIGPISLPRRLPMAIGSFRRRRNVQLIASRLSVLPDLSRFYQGPDFEWASTPVPAFAVSYLNNRVHRKSYKSACHGSFRFLASAEARVDRPR